MNWNEFLELDDKYSSDEIKKKCIKFVFLWMEYNTFYNKTYDEPKERDRAKALNIETINEKYNSVKERYLRTFEQLPCSEGIRTFIKNMQNGRKIYYDRNENNLEKLLSVVYQIRCNLFHGDKLAQDSNAKIIAWAYDCLYDLLKDTEVLTNPQ